MATRNLPGIDIPHVVLRSYKTESVYLTGCTAKTGHSPEELQPRGMPVCVVPHIAFTLKSTLNEMGDGCSRTTLAQFQFCIRPAQALICIHRMFSAEQRLRVVRRQRFMDFRQAQLPPLPPQGCFFSRRGTCAIRPNSHSVPAWINRLETHHQRAKDDCLLRANE